MSIFTTDPRWTRDHSGRYHFDDTDDAHLCPSCSLFKYPDIFLDMFEQVAATVRWAKHTPTNLDVYRLKNEMANVRRKRYYCHSTTTYRAIKSKRGADAVIMKRSLESCSDIWNPELIVAWASKGCEIQFVCHKPWQQHLSGILCDRGMTMELYEFIIDGYLAGQKQESLIAESNIPASTFKKLLKEYRDMTDADGHIIT